MHAPPSLGYYKAWCEHADGEGWYFLEIDWKTDMVVRQITLVDKKYRWGKWTGSRLVGEIADQPPSSFGEWEREEITPDVFESVWLQATSSNPDCW